MWAPKDERRVWPYGQHLEKARKVTFELVYHLNDFILLVSLCHSFQSSKLTYLKNKQTQSN